VTRVYRRVAEGCRNVTLHNEKQRFRTERLATLPTPQHSYEYERIWMAVNDNNRPYGSFSCSAGYSLWFEDSVLVLSGLDSDGNPFGSLF
jgi:hypothetical protein